MVAGRPLYQADSDWGLLTPEPCQAVLWATKGSESLAGQLLYTDSCSQGLGTEEQKTEHLSQEPAEGFGQPHKAAERLYPAEGIHPSPGTSLWLPGQTILRFSYPDADTRPWRLPPGSSSQDKVLLQRNINSQVGSRVAEGEQVNTHIPQCKGRLQRASPC